MFPPVDLQGEHTPAGILLGHVEGATRTGSSGGIDVGIQNTLPLLQWKPPFDGLYLLIAIDHETGNDRPLRLRSLVRRQVQKTGCELATLLNLAAQGSAPASIVGEIRKREEHTEALQAEREQLAAATQLSALDTDGLREDVRDRLSHFAALMRTQQCASRTTGHQEAAAGLGATHADRS